MEGPDYIIFRRRAYRGRGGTNIKRKEKKREEMD